MERMIETVKDNKDKQNTYRENIRRYNKAMKEGFYLEAILIDYAMIEDRLRSYIYHLGLMNTRDSRSANGKKAKSSLKEIIAKYKREKENDTFIIKTITGKLKIVRCTLAWAEEENFEINDRYLQVLRDQYDRYVDVGGMISAIAEVEVWCKYRNEIIHGLLNKNESGLQESLLDQAQKGMELARFIDGQVKCVKKGNRIRKSVNLQSK